MKIRSQGYTLDNIDELEYDVEAFTNSYKAQAVGPAKTEVFMEFMNSAIPKISKDVLTKEYRKQKENEDRLNQAITILKEKNQMLADNLKEMEDEHGNKQDMLEDLEIKLKNATKAEELLLQRAELEAEKRRELMDDLENERGRNQELDQKRAKAEQELKKREQKFAKEQREGNQKAALGANISKEEASRIKDRSRAGGRALRNGEVDVDGIDVEEKSEQDEVKSTAEDNKKGKKNKKKKIGGTRKGEGGCKCVIF